ncbi:transposase [Burkholderia multivorans]|nr:transposase [Burkholderia multivorans]
MDINFRDTMTDRPRKYQHHPTEFKRQVVEASLVPGTSVAALALQHGINANQVWAWRKLYKEGCLDTGTQPLLAVDVVDTEPKPTQTPPAGHLEITIGLARLRVSGTVDPLLLKTAIAALRS